MTKLSEETQARAFAAYLESQSGPLDPLPGIGQKLALIALAVVLFFLIGAMLLPGLGSAL